MNSGERWTADEVADYLGIQRRSVYAFARRLEGFPQAKYVGRTPTWAPKEIKEWRRKHPARRRQE